MNYCPQCAEPLAEVSINDEARRACPARDCGYVHWNNPTPVVAMIVEVDDTAESASGEGGVVMAHNVAWPETFYSIITGFLEAGEDPRDCAIRETKEELGLVASDCELVGVYAFPEQNQVIIAYHVHASGDIVLNEELDAYRIVAPQDIEPWPMGTGLALSDWLARRSAS